MLNKKEKKYLSFVIKPFKERVTGIRKCFNVANRKEYIEIELYQESAIWLPFFELDEMYKGMEQNKIYTVEELLGG